MALTDATAEAMFSYQNWIGDINVNYLAGSSKIGTVGSLGLSLKTLSFGDIMETTITNPEGTGTTFSPTYLTLGLTYSRKMTDRILFGATAKFVSEKIMGTAANGVGFDFGLQYVSPISGLKLGVVLANFGGNMKFDGNNLEQRTVLPGTEAGTVSSSVAVPTADFDLPSQLKIGVSYEVGLGESMGLDVMGSFVNNSYSFDQYIVGGEFEFKDMVFLRASYALAYKQGIVGQDDGFVSANEDFLFGPSFGVGVNLNVGVPLQLDYAYQITEFFNDAQWVSLAVGF